MVLISLFQLSYPDINLRNKIHQFQTSTKISCPECTVEVILAEYDGHYVTHHSNQKLVCKFCSIEFTSLAAFNQHTSVDTGDCLQQTGYVCPFSKIGCTDEIFETRDACFAHVTHKQITHLKLIYDSLIGKIQAKTNNSLETIESNYQNLVQDFTLLQHNHDLLSHEVIKLRECNKEYKTICSELQRVFTLTKVSWLSIDERLNNQDNVSFDGLFIWKISNFYEKQNQSKTGVQRSFYSPPFYYMGRTGYKLIARIFLNGDGAGHSTHVSLFISIMRGEYDALIKWPFTHNITFTIYDQSLSNPKEHHTDRFYPDPNSTTFRRPTTEMSTGSGIPKFCSLEKIPFFVKDNVMFIKIQVE